MTVIVSRRTFFAGGLCAAASSFVLPQSSLAQSARLVIGKTFVASSLDPADGNAGWALVSHGVAETLFTVGRDGQIAPALAQSAERRTDTAWTVTLTPGRRFADGAAATANEIAAALSRNVERNPATRATAGLVRFTAVGELQLEVATERPTPALANLLAEWSFAVARRAAQTIVHSGPYRVTAFESGARLALEPNPFWPRPPRAPVTIVRFQDGQALALAFRGGELDMAFNLPVETLSMVRGESGRVVRSFPVAYQYMAIVNTRRSGLADEKVRRALAMAIDRVELARALRAGKPSASIWASPFPFASGQVPSVDRESAERLLDEAGWRRGASGLRSRDGHPLRLSLWAYPQRPDLLVMQPVLRAQLAAVGVGVETRVTEQAQTVARSGEFDLLLWAQHTAPSGDPAFFPGLFLESSGANNFGGWQNDEADALIRALGGESVPAARNETARRIDDLVRRAAPVIPLVTPEWHVGLSRRLAHYEPWGSDYYIVRADLDPTA